MPSVIKTSARVKEYIEVAFSKPSLDTLIDIAKALDTTVSDLTKFD